MRYRPLLLHTFTAASLLVAFGAVSIPTAQAADYANAGYTKTGKTSVNPESLEAYTLVALDRVYFKYEQSNLSAKEKNVLKDTLSRFYSNPKAVIELRGYADGMESRQGETALGNTRAQVIARYLTANGVPPGRIVSVAPDEVSDAATSDEDSSMNPQHRRVDIRVFEAPDGAKSGESRVQLSSLR
jgi:outer membrane protein OmpA-like peptidoglycan-associated protein